MHACHHPKHRKRTERLGGGLTDGPVGAGLQERVLLLTAEYGLTGRGCAHGAITGSPVIGRVGVQLWRADRVLGAGRLEGGAQHQDVRAAPVWQQPGRQEQPFEEPPQP